MITARYESHLFPRERSSSPHLGPSRCTPPPSSSSSTKSASDGDDIDRFMELALAALDEATKEEEAKGVVQELVERALARTGAPSMADVIAEQLRSQEVIEQLAERSFERQRKRQQLHQKQPISLCSSSSSSRLKRKSDINLASRIPNNQSVKKSDESTLSSYSSPSSSQITSLSFTTTPVSSSSSSPSPPLPLPIEATSLSSISPPSPSASSAAMLTASLSSPSLTDPHDSESLDEAVTRDQFTIQSSQHLHTGPNRLLLISEYIWRLFRLLILASLVALVYHYVCTYPHQLFFVL